MQKKEKATFHILILIQFNIQFVCWLKKWNSRQKVQNNS